MQRQVRYTIIQAAKADLGEETDTAELVDDFGFEHDWHDTLDSWIMFKNYHILPFAGGWLDQPLWVRNSFRTLQAVYNEEIDVLRQKIFRMEDVEYKDDETGATIKLEF